jgi:hypothetical protein
MRVGVRREISLSEIAGLKHKYSKLTILFLVVFETAFFQSVEVLLCTIKVLLMQQKGIFWHQIPGGNSAREFGY